MSWGRSLWHVLKTKLQRVISKNVRDIPQGRKLIPFGACRPKIYKVESTELRAESLWRTSALRLKSNISNTFRLPTVTSMEADGTFAPPNSVRGMKTLDREAFTKVLKLTAVRVPVERVSSLNKKVSKLLFKAPGIRPIAELDEEDPDHGKYRLFLLHPQKILHLEEAEKIAFAENGVNIHSQEHYDIDLSYNNFSYDEVLSAVFPDNVEGVGGFSSIGHIVHLNLREELLEYKEIIGEVLLDKIPAAKTVVNKTNTIDNTYRNFKMEILAGEDNLITKTREHGLTFELDFSKVYWNPRLATEHQRIINGLKARDIVYDVFAGIGPFAVPAAKKGCFVLANDLNPESFRWLQHNAKLNKVKPELMQSFNMDGREFIQTALKVDLLNHLKSEANDNKIHIVMNLPALAIEFLDAFKGLLAEHKSENVSFKSPLVYCYGFSKSDNPKEDIKLRTEAVLGRTLPVDYTIRTVRNVAPNKDMLCVAFGLTEDVLFAPPEDLAVGELCEPHEKKPKLESL